MKYSCICGDDKWPCRETRRLWAYLEWKSTPGLVDPLGEWFRQMLPSTKFTRRDIDAITHHYPTETTLIAEFSASPIQPKKLRDIQRANIADIITVQMVRYDEMKANVPERLHHYPTPCRCCGMPQQPVPADALIVNGQETTATDLKGILLGTALILT